MLDEILEMWFFSKHWLFSRGILRVDAFFVVPCPVILWGFGRITFSIAFLRWFFKFTIEKIKL